MKFREQIIRLEVWFLAWRPIRDKWKVAKCKCCQGGKVEIISETRQWSTERMFCGLNEAFAGWSAGLWHPRDKVLRYFWHSKFFLAPPVVVHQCSTGGRWLVHHTQPEVIENLLKVVNIIIGSHQGKYLFWRSLVSTYPSPLPPMGLFWPAVAKG